MAAKLGSPIAKWVLIGVVAIALIVSTWWMTYDHMRTKYEREKQEAIQASFAAASAEARKQLLAERALNATVLQARDEKERALSALVDEVRKKARRYANVKVQIPTDVVLIHDQYARMPNDTHSATPKDADLGSGRTEVQSRPVQTEAEQRVRVNFGEQGFVEMTLENAVLMLSETYATLQRMEQDYRAFSEWNDGRETIELSQGGEQ
jgi:hypothetical protein